MGVLGFYRRLFHYQKPYALILSLVLISLLLSVFFQCTQPLIIKWLLNEVLPGKNAEQLKLAISLLILNYLIFVLAFQLRIRSLAKLGANVISLLRFKLFIGLENHANRLADTEKMALFSQHLNQLETVSLFQTWSVVADLLMALVGGGLLFYFNWLIALLVIPLLLIIFVMPRYFSQQTKQSAIQKQAVENALLDEVQENMRMHEVIRLSLLQRFKRQKFKQKLRNSVQANRVYNLHLGLTSISLSLGINLAMLVIASSGSYLVFKNQLSIGSFVGFILLFRSFLSAVDGISSALPVLLRSAASLTLIEAFIQSKKATEKGLQSLPALSTAIRFNSVCFAYDQNPILKSLQFAIQAGQSLCIVGPSGSGKSSCLKLLLKEISPSSGSILFDSHDYSRIKEKALFTQMAVVMQQPKLFEASILDNIRMGKLSASEAEIIAAAKKAGVHEDIMNLPEQYATLVAHHQAALSGGQMQRVCIARALIAKPQILCLDEATSALDPFAADCIEQTLLQMRGEYTLISVTHRLSSAVQADQILVMDRGQIVESGNHQSLLAEKGLYYQLWQKQHGFIFNQNYKEVSVIPTWLKTIPLFSGLDSTSLEQAAKSFEMLSLQKDSVVFHEQDIGDRFYIIVAGKVSILSSSNPLPIAVLEDGDFFGEVALIYDTPRSMTVKTESYCVFLSLHYQAFRQVIQKLPQKKIDYLLAKAEARLSPAQKNQRLQARLFIKERNHDQD